MSVDKVINAPQKPVSGFLEEHTFPVTGMACAGCASSVESILGQVDGIEKAQVNFAANTVWVAHEQQVSPEVMHAALNKVGFGLIINTENPMEAQHSQQREQWLALKWRTFWAGVLTLPVFVIGMFFMEWEAGPWVSLAFSIPIIFWYGRGYYGNAWKQAQHGKANMDTLVAVSTSIAFFYSAFSTIFPQFWLSKGLQPHVYYEAATVIITFVSLGKLLEARAKSNTTAAIQKLMGMQPSNATVYEGGQMVSIPVADVVPGQVVVVKPGQQIPVDGQVVEGKSYVDESMVTGEPIPVKKNNGALVYAGTVNQKGSFKFEAHKVGEATVLAQIIKTVQQAQGSKAPVQRLVDRVAGIFVPLVMVIALVTFIVWLAFGGTGVLPHALMASVAVLVIACPCALGLATPTAIMVGIGKGAENNILIKDAESLELAYKTKVVVLDKTGTLTQGKPQVTDVFWVNGKDTHAEALLSIELQSEHPLGSALTDWLKAKGYQPATTQRFQSLTGMGVEATSMDGMTYYVGNQALMEAKGIALSPETIERAKQWQDLAKTTVFFAHGNTLQAVFAIADQVKAEAPQAIKALQNQGVLVYMLTGDNYTTAKAVANQVGISRFEAGMLPTEKASYIRKLQTEGKVVAMVGDGINDSEALAQAEVSMAMGQGADIAMDVAKITLNTTNLEAIPKAFELSRKTVRGIRQNLFWAFIYNLIGLPIAAGLLYPINGFLLNPMLAGAAMALSSVSVVANSLRLKRIQL